MTREIQLSLLQSARAFPLKVRL